MTTKKQASRKNSHLAASLLGHLLRSQDSLQDVVTLENGQIAVMFRSGDLRVTLTVDSDQLEIG